MATKADFVITNAKVFTSNRENPRAEAVAIKGNRIVYVGTSEGAKNYTDKSTRVVDGQGRTVTPGFIDSHFHLLWGAISMGGAQLYDATDVEGVQNVLRSFAAENKTNEWVEGRGVKYNIISSRAELDAVTADRPIYINAYDGHTSWEYKSAGNRRDLKAGQGCTRQRRYRPR